MKKLNNKIKQSETVVLNRSQITLAEYNPRKITDEARNKLKRNLRQNGLLGGIVFNKQTGNLVSGHQRISVMDEVNWYDRDPDKHDYQIKAEVIDVDLKKEKELNLFFNSRAVQGEFDYSKLSEIINDIDTDLAGLDDIDISMIMTEVPDVSDFEIPVFNPQQEKKEEAEEERTEQEKIEHVKNIKAEVKEGAVYEGDPYFTVSFDNFANKAMFMEMLGLDPEAKFVKGEDFADMIDEM